MRGLKIGIFGMITPQTPQTTNPLNVATLRFGSLAPEALSAAKTLRRRGADIVIAAIHAGGKCGSSQNPRDVSSCGSREELFEMFEELPPGTLDAVVAGHTHQILGHFVKGTPVIETSGLGASFGMIDLWVDSKQKAVIAEKTQIRPAIPICARTDERGSCDLRKLREAPSVHLMQATFLGRPVVPDLKLGEILAPAQERVLSEQNRKLGIKVPRELERNREGESALGDVLADAMREMERADVALLNPGGIRADIPSGELTYGAVYSVLPFENSVATLSLTGEELSRLLQAAYGGRRGIYQQSGLQMTLIRCPDSVRLKAVKLANGKPVVLDRRYKVTMPDFLASGGDGLAPVISTLPTGQIDLGNNRELGLRDSLAAFIQKQKRELVAPKPGRFQFSDDPAQCASPGS
jgi:5'-nucleotidase